jgi:hypothetical protein
LRLQQINFTRCCLCCPTILLDIAIAVHQFYQILPLLPHHFTGYYTCSAPILPDLAFACTIVLPQIALAGGLAVLTAAIDRSIGVWESQPIWDNLIAFFDLPYLAVDQASLVPGLASGCAFSTTPNWGLQ